MAKAKKKELVEMATREQVIIGADTAPVYYANYLGMLGTKGDVRLRLGQVGDSTPESVNVHVLAHVYIAPSHMIDFIKLLVTKMQQYGELFPNSEWTRLLEQIKVSGGNDKAQAE